MTVVFLGGHGRGDGTGLQQLGGTKSGEDRMLPDIGVLIPVVLALDGAVADHEVGVYPTLV